MPSYDDYDRATQRLRVDLAALPPGAPVRLAKGTSNLFRPREPGVGGLDVRAFTGVLSVDEQARTADVLGMTTYEDLVDATMPHGLVPLVVPELKTITIGGAVSGLGIEATSFRAGGPHESVLDMDVLTGAGEIVTVRPGDDLFAAFPNSYGTLGYALRLRIELEPARPFVSVRHWRYSDPGDYFAAVAEAARSGEHDFVDGTAFAPDELYLTTASYADTAPATSDYTWLEIYYRSIRERTEDWLTVRDWLWRWDTDWFWCSRAFGAQQRWVRRLAGRRLLRSDIYWKLVALERRYAVKARLDRRRGLPDREPVVQDVQVPADRAAELLDFLAAEIGLWPVWVCPYQQRDARIWPLYELDPATLYVNFGVWGTVPIRPGDADGDRNRGLEQIVTKLGGRKSLYSMAHYEREEFWRLYNGPAYDELKRRHDPEGRLLDLYDKVVRRR
jgi:FAD/FMN-containing dehydrogenase